MTDLDAAIRERLEIRDTGESTDFDPRFVYDCELVQGAMLAVLELHRPEAYSRRPFCAHCRESGIGYEGAVPYPCPTVLAIAKGLGIEP